MFSVVMVTFEYKTRIQSKPGSQISTGFSIQIGTGSTKPPDIQPDLDMDLVHPYSSCCLSLINASPLNFYSTPEILVQFYSDKTVCVSVCDAAEGSHGYCSGLCFYELLCNDLKQKLKKIFLPSLLLPDSKHFVILVHGVDRLITYNDCCITYCGFVLWLRCCSFGSCMQLPVFRGSFSFTCCHHLSWVM